MSITRNLNSYIQEVITNIRNVDHYGQLYKEIEPGISGLQVYNPNAVHTIYLTAGDNPHELVASASTPESLVYLSATDYFRRIYTVSAYPAGNNIGTFELMLSGIYKYALNSINYKDNWIDINQAFHGFSKGQVIYYNVSTTRYELATNEKMIVGIVSNIIDANNFSIVTNGYVFGLSNLTTGPYYISNVPGIMTTAASSGTFVFLALSETDGYFYNSNSDFSILKYIWPTTQVSGALTNDGGGNLQWTNGYTGNLGVSGAGGTKILNIVRGIITGVS